MKKNIEKILALSLISSMTFANLSFAEQQDLIKKSETVYVTVEGNEIKDKSVSVWLNSDKNIKANDKSNLTNVKDLKTDKELKSENGYLKLDENKKDIYYKGDTDKKLPVDVSVKYFLDGKEMKASELEGKSGHLKIVITSKNNRYEAKTIDGQSRNVYSPYVVVAAMTFDDEKVENITSDDIKVVKDGKNEIVTTVMTPGMKQNLSKIVEDKELDNFKDEVSVEMDIKDYKPVEIYSVITNEFFQEKKNIDSLDKLQNGVKELQDNSQKLVDASVKLSEGQDKLNSGISQMQTGVTKLHSGSQKLASSTQQMQGKFSGLQSKVGPIQGYVAQMNDGSLKLYNGISDYTAAVGKIKENTAKIKEGSEKLAKGATDLDNGVGKLKDATSQLRAGTENMKEMNAQKDQLLEKSTQLSNGLNGLAGSYGQLADTVEQISGKSQQLKDSSAQFNEKLQQVAQLAGGAETSASAEKIARGLESSAEGLNNAIQQLQANNEEGQLDETIAYLQAQKNVMYVQAESIRNAGSQNAGQQKLQAALAQLAQSSTALSQGNADLSNALMRTSAAMNQSKAKLVDSSNQLSQGLGQMGGALNGADGLSTLKDSIDKLDDATGQIKGGSQTLKEGTLQNEKAMAMLLNGMEELDKNSSALVEGSSKLSGGLQEFNKQSALLSSLSQINEKAIIPMSNAINMLNDGLGKLDSSTGQLKSGSDELASGQKEFSSKLKEYKEKGIDELSNKTKDLNKFKDIIDAMSDLAVKDSSFTGTDNNFETKSRIVEKIK
ncbi:Chromosome partition protein Smc [Finegoldia magna]|uniref:Chromosome partition protein Smc n=1 Tax=Finegoldia magna TaxID=1260 RepID=A0A6N3CJ31_FINMA